MINIFLGDFAIGDDCIAIINGSSYINITNIACGPGQGIRLVHCFYVYLLPRNTFINCAKFPTPSIHI